MGKPQYLTMFKSIWIAEKPFAISSLLDGYRDDSAITEYTQWAYKKRVLNISTN